MKQRIISLSILLCLLLTLAACGGHQTSGEDQANSPMSEEAYQEQADALSADVGTAIASLGSLTATDEASLREGIEAIRAMATPFRDFAAISNPPEAWTEAHGKVAAGCTLFADSLEGMCDSLTQMLDGKIT